MFSWIAPYTAAKFILTLPTRVHLKALIFKGECNFTNQSTAIASKLTNMELQLVLMVETSIHVPYIDVLVVDYTSFKRDMKIVCSVFICIRA